MPTKVQGIGVANKIVRAGSMLEVVRPSSSSSMQAEAASSSGVGGGGGVHATTASSTESKSNANHDVAARTALSTDDEQRCNALGLSISGDQDFGDLPAGVKYSSNTTSQTVSNELARLSKPIVCAPTSVIASCAAGTTSSASLPLGSAPLIPTDPTIAHHNEAHESRLEESFQNDETESRQNTSGALRNSNAHIRLSMVQTSIHRQPQPDLLQTDDSMTSLESLDMTPNCSATGNVDPTDCISPSFELKDDYESSVAAQKRERNSISSDGGSSATSTPSRNRPQHDVLPPQTIVTRSPRAHQSSPKQQKANVIDLAVARRQQQHRNTMLKSSSCETGDGDMPNEPISPTKEQSNAMETQDIDSRDMNIRGMSSLPIESSDDPRHRLSTEKPGASTQQQLSVIDDARQMPVSRTELHRRSTIKKSNVSSSSPFEPGSLLDDEQSSCSEQRLTSRKYHQSQSSLIAGTDRHAKQTPLRRSITIPSAYHSTTTKPATPFPTGKDKMASLSATSDAFLPKLSTQQPTLTKTQTSETFDEKKDNEDTDSQNQRRARLLNSHPSILRPDMANGDNELRDCLSATESEVASFDGLPSGLQKRWLMGESPREKMLQSLDGIHAPLHTRSSEQEEPLYQPTPPRVVLGGGSRKTYGTNVVSNEEEDGTCDGPLFAACFDLNMWGSLLNNEEKKEQPKNGATTNKGHWRTSSWKQQHDVPLAILDCANIINQEDRCAQFAAQMAPRGQTSSVRASTSDYPNPTYAETILPTEVDPRMQDWIASQYTIRERPPRDGSYHLGKSRTVIVHEIVRGNWTWCTDWSPDGAFLAIATENHHLAIVETTSSTVWRVCHDRRVRSPQKNNATQSIRSVAWGSKYIAIGGTGNAVSILSPTEPYDVLHTIPGTGFVGSLQWRGDSNVLAIGSRLDLVLIARLRESSVENMDDTTRLECDMYRIEFKYWANSVAFSPDGSYLAVGDSGGIVSVYDYDESEKDVETNMTTWFKRKDSILSIEWSPDGKWLYAGGEDRSVTVIDTTYWEIIHKLGQDRWVQTIASSNSGTHVAIGGVSSEISILDVENGWDSVMGIELKGLVPLSAKWHPRDQYLVMTGQDNSVLAVETTNARHVKGHHLHSISPIRAIEFSPDGRMSIIGNESGVVTFYSLSGTTFITAYELVVPLSSSACVRWSLNGMFIVVGSISSLVVVGRKRNKRQGKKNPPNVSGFSIRKVIHDVGPTHAVSIDFQSNYIATSCANVTRILDVKADFATVQEWKKGPYYANAWSPDGRWLAMIGKEKYLRIYDTSAKSADRWKAIFSMKCDFVGRALAWGPLTSMSGLLYLAYGGDSNEIYVMEIRTREGTWETVLNVPRDASINVLDWSPEGLLAAGIGNGTVSIVDLAYLQSGVAVSEMDYNWQRQALTCFTEIRRNRGDNSIRTLRWLDRLLAVGGTDGEVEIIDLTERQRCKGYARSGRVPSTSQDS